MANRSWDELVKEGQKLLSEEGRIEWRWGDLALEVEAAVKRGGRGGGSTSSLRKWADEIGYEEATGRPFENLLRFRQVAAAWPPDKRRANVSYTVHRELATHPDRFDLIHDGMTSWEARRATGRTPYPADRIDRVEQAKEALTNPDVAKELLSDPQIRHLIDESRPSQERAEQARRLLRDPGVAREVVRDDAARSTMARAAKDMEEESDQRQRERSPGLVGMSDFYQAAGELSRARQALTKALDAMRRVDLSEDERESLREDANRATLVLEWISSYLESGDHSFDRELDALLREET